MLEFNISGQTMTRIDKFSPASDSVDYLTAKFNFKSSEWNGKAKTALFRLGDVVYPVLIGSNNTCKVASEVLAHGNSRYFHIHGGEFQVSVLGEYNSIKITTNEITVKFKPNGYGSTQTPSEPTAGMYEQILSAYADAQTASENAEAAANAAVEECKDTVDSLANAVKGNLTGAVVRADDVSPVEHNPAVKVHGKNLCSMNAFDSMSQNGAANTYDASTHTITMGADTALSNFTGRYCRPLGSNFKVGVVYTISFEVRGTSGKIVACGWDTGRINITLTNSFERYYVTKRATRADEVVSFYSISTEKGGLANGEYMQFDNVQIEESETMTDFVEYIEPSTVLVSRCGKNLLPNNSGSYTLNGITFTKNSDDSIKVSGTATETTTNIFSHTAKVVNGQRYILSGCPAGGSTGKTYVLRCFNSLGDETVRDDEGNGIEFTFQNARGTYNFAIVVFKGASINAIFRPMLRFADVEDGTFEAYNGADFTPSSNGTVEGITSLSPIMNLLTDTEGIIIDCEYNKDTNKVIQKLMNAIIALGGAVS